MRRQAAAAISTLCLLIPLSHSRGQEKPPVEPGVAKLASLAHPTTIVATIVIAKEAIRQQLEQTIPREENGSQGDPVGMPVVDDVLSWHFARSDLRFGMGGGQIAVGTTIGGSANIRGNVRLIRGDIGKLLGKLNPTNIPFSATANVRISVDAAARPQLLPAWRLQPNLSATANVEEARIPILHVGDISVRGKLQDAINGKLGALRGQLEAAMRDDRRIEDAARRAWDQLCRAHPIDIDKDGKPDLYLRVAPTLARATQPILDEAGLTIQVGIEANTEVSGDGGKPDCPFPAVLQLLPLEKPRFDIALPAEIPFERLNELAKASLPSRHELPDYAVSAEIRSVKFSAADGGRLAVELDGSFSEKRFLFGKTLTGAVTLRARPVLDDATQQLRFENATLDVRSQAFFGAAELLAKGAAPLLSQWVEQRLRIDIAKEAQKLPVIAQRAVEELTKKSDALDIDAQFETPKLTAVEFDATRLRLIAEAHGRVSVKVK